MIRNRCPNEVEKPMRSPLFGDFLCGGCFIAEEEAYLSVIED